jgi:hypothetical protein
VNALEPARGAGALSLAQRKQLAQLECALDRLELELLLDAQQEQVLDRAVRGLIARGTQHALLALLRHVALRIARRQFLGKVLG